MIFIDKDIELCKENSIINKLNQNNLKFYRFNWNSKNIIKFINDLINQCQMIDVVIASDLFFETYENKKKEKLNLSFNNIFMIFKYLIEINSDIEIIISYQIRE